MKSLSLPTALVVVSLGALASHCGPGGSSDGGLSDASQDTSGGGDMRCSIPDGGMRCSPCIDTATGMPNGCMACYDENNILQILCA